MLETVELFIDYDFDVYANGNIQTRINSVNGRPTGLLLRSIIDALYDKTDFLDNREAAIEAANDRSVFDPPDDG